MKLIKEKRKVKEANGDRREEAGKEKKREQTKISKEQGREKKKEVIRKR